MDRFSSSKIPLQIRLSNLLQDKILRGNFEPGQRLPTEVQLAEEHKVSRITVRGALTILESKGLIHRIRAKGTFVAHSIPLAKQHIVSGSISNIIREAEKFVVRFTGMEIMTVQNTRINREIQSFFTLHRNDKIACIKRTRYLGSFPISYLENFLPMELAEKIDQEALHTTPLLSILKDKLKLSAGNSEMFLEAIPAEQEIATALDSPLLMPVFLSTAYLKLPDGKPFEIATLYMRPEFFKYRVEVTPENLNQHM